MSLARSVRLYGKRRTTKGLENNTSASVALEYGTASRADTDESVLAERQGVSLLGPAPFKIYRETVAAHISAEDVTQRRRAAKLPVPNRNSA